MPEAAAAVDSRAGGSGPGDPPASVAGRSAPAPDPSVERPSVAAAWFERVVVIAVIVFVAVGLVGLAAAIAGVARPLLVFPTGLVVAAGVVALWRPGQVASPSSPARTWVVVAGTVVILGTTAWNAQYHAQHIITNRDQGIYVNGGKWIAEDGSLVVEGRGPGLEGATGIYTNALGQQSNDGDDTDLEIQSLHLLHTYMAEGAWVGGNRGLFLTPVVIGGLALAVLFLLALRMLPGPLALVAVTALATNFIWFHSVRDALSEPLLLLTTFGGLWFVLVAAADGRPGRLAVAGAVLGAGTAVRLDAGVGIALVFTLVGLIAARRAARRHRALSDGLEPADRGATGAGMLLVVLAGFAGPAVIGFLDVTQRSAFYLKYQRESSDVILAFVAAGIVSAFALNGAEVIWSRLEGRGAGAKARAAGRLLARCLPALALSGAVATVAIVAFAWFIRPELGPVRAERPANGRAAMSAIQRQEGLPSDPDRTYAEGSVRRIAWYMGGPAVALGGAGLAVVAYRVLRGRASDIELGLVAVAVPATLLFVYRPGIYNDQPWMMRRYLPQVMPGLLLFGGVAAAAAGRMLADLRSHATWARLAPGPTMVVVTVVAAAVQIGGTLPVSVPLRAVRTEAGGRAGIERVCEAVGPDAVVIMGNEGNVSLTLVPAVRGFCGVPTARPIAPAGSGPLPLADLVPRVERAGRTLWVVASTREVLRVLAPNATEVRAIPILQTSGLVATISKPPSKYRDVSLGLWVGKVESVP